MDARVLISQSPRSPKKKRNRKAMWSLCCLPDRLHPQRMSPMSSMPKRLSVTRSHLLPRSS
jgi:hypothetical protein